MTTLKIEVFVVQPLHYLGGLHLVRILCYGGPTWTYKPFDCESGMVVETMDTSPQ